MVLDLNECPIYISGSNTSFNEKFNENLSNSFKVLDKGIAQFVWKSLKSGLSEYLK